MAPHLPFPEDPAIPKWKRAYLFVIATFSFLGVAGSGYLIKYLGAEVVFGVIAMVIFIVAGVISGWPALYPREIEAKFVGFARNAAWVSTILLVVAAALALAGWKIGPPYA